MISSWVAKSKDGYLAWSKSIAALVSASKNDIPSGPDTDDAEDADEEAFFLLRVSEPRLSKTGDGALELSE